MSLLILGVGHVFRIADQVDHLIRRHAPTAVCVELDAQRMAALQQPPEADLSPPPGTPRSYRKLAEFQRGIARRYGTRVGDEMRGAIRAARTLNAEVVLVDMDAQRMVSRVRTEMGFWEKARFALELVRARFTPNASRKMDAEVKRVQDDPDAVIEELGKKFPTVKRILLDERNAHMAAGIRQAMARHARVAAVVGDGHVEGIAHALRDLAPTVVRLKEIRALRVPAAAAWRVEDGGATLRFGHSTTWQAPTDEA